MVLKDILEDLECWALISKDPSSSGLESDDDQVLNQNQPFGHQ